MRAALSVVALLGLAACSSDSGDLDGGTDAAPRDAVADAMPRDASAADADPADADPADADPADADPADAAPADADTPDAAPADAEPEDTGPSCVPGAPCSGNPSPCRLGQIVCSSSGEACVDGPPAADGLACTGGLCGGGECLPPLFLSTTLDLTAEPITPGRTCGEAPQFSVVALEALAATVTSTPAPECLTAGDEILLINLQGAQLAHTNTGTWELLEVAAVTGTRVDFAQPKTRSYGDAAGADTGVGVGPGEQKVALIRVPRFGALTIQGGVTLGAARWDGQLGGVLALRAGALTVEGTITAAELGYTGGRWSRDNSDCDDNLDTEPGESIGGPGLAGTTANLGGSGGIAAATDLSFNGDTPISPSAGHAVAGEPGMNAGGRTLGEPGIAYGAGDASRLTMGSGPGGNLTCNFTAGPTLIQSGVRAGGIILLLGGAVTVAPAGAITATPPDAPRDVAASGGYVYIRGSDLTLGSMQVTAMGAIGHGGSPTTAGLFNVASPGYVVLAASGTITGTTAPAANVIAF